MLGNESILAVDYRIEGGALYRYHANTVERIVPWGPEADARRMTKGVWQTFVPEIDVSGLEENARHPGTTRWPGWRRRIAACRFLVESWPEEVRDGVRGFPSAHWQLLQLVNEGGAQALELLRSNPALGYLAAMSGAAGKIGLRRRELAALFGFPGTEHAVRLLGKVSTAWISCEFLAQLRTAMTDERDTDALLTHLAHINPIALEVARDPELRAAVAPDCIARLGRTPASSAQTDLIARMRGLLDSAPRLHFRTLADLDRPALAPTTRAAPRHPRNPRRNETFAFPAPSPRRSATPAIPPPPPPRARDDLDLPACAAPMQVAIAAIRQSRRTRFEFPPPPLPDLAALGVRIVAIRSQPDLIAESDAMRHCAGRDRSYARRVADGTLYFYRMLEPERLTLAIRPARQGWTVEEIRGLCNRLPRDSSCRLVSNWLRSPY